MNARIASGGCPPQETFAALADGELTHNHADRVREHLQGCSTCRARQQHYGNLVRSLGALETPPDPSFAAEVSARLQASDRRPSPFRLLAPALVAAAAVAVFALATHRAPAEAPEFAARGALVSQPSAHRHLGFEAYVHPATAAGLGHALQDGDVLRPTDGLSFRLYNRSGHESRFLLFGIDAQGTVHWFYPAYLAPGTDPTSPVLAATPEVVALEDGVTPDRPAPGMFEVVAVFGPREMRVQQVESLLGRGSLEELRKRLPDAEIQVISARIAVADEGKKP